MYSSSNSTIPKKDVSNTMLVLQSQPDLSYPKGICHSSGRIVMWTTSDHKRTVNLENHLIWLLLWPFMLEKL